MQDGGEMIAKARLGSGVAASTLVVHSCAGGLDRPLDDHPHSLRQRRTLSRRQRTSPRSRVGPMWSFLSMGLSMNSRPPVPAESSSHEGVLASAHVAYSCGVNSKSHNPSGRGFDPHPPHLSCTNARR